MRPLQQKILKCDLAHSHQMDVIEREGIKVPNAVIVSGLTNTDKNEKVFEFLKKYGPIDRIMNLISVSDPISEYYSKIIGEYSFGLQ